MIFSSKAKKLLIIYTIGILTYICCANLSTAAPILQTTANYLKMSPSVPWDISATHLSYCSKEGIYKLSGNVIIKKKQITIKSNFLLFDHQNMLLSTKSDTSVKLGNDCLVCKAMSINIDRETGSFYDGVIFLEKNNLQISGKKFEKIDTNTYFIHKGNLTSCIGSSPMWLISGDNIYFEKGKHGVIRKAILKIKGIPILSLPYILFPTTKRQSGLLTPEIRYTNNTLSYCQPLFLRTNDWSDITFYPFYELDSKTSIGLEYRYILNHTTKGLIMIDWGKNNGINNTPKEDSSQTNLSSEESNYFYWIRSKCVQKLPFDLVAKLGIDLVSDNYSFENNKEGYSGFYKTEKYFKSFMKKDLLPSNAYTRENYLILNKTWPYYTLSASTYWNNLFQNETFFKNKDTYSKSSKIQFSSTQKRIKSFPLYFNLEASHGYEKNNNNTEQKIEIKPNITVTQALKNIAILDLSIGTDQTFTTNNGNLFNNNFNNLNFKTSITSEMSKIFNTKSKKNLKHSLKLSAVYECRRNSVNCSGDFGEKHNSLTYSIVNSIISKSDNTFDEFSSKKNKYAELLYLRLKQSFNWGNKVSHFSDIFGELHISIMDYFTLQTQIEYSPQIASINLHILETYLSKNEDFCISTAYLYKKDKVKLIESHFGTTLNKQLTLIASCGYNYTEKKILAESVGFYYVAQCWSANINYKNDRNKDSQSISISVELFGFGRDSNDTYVMGKDKFTKIISLQRKRWISESN